MPENDHLMPETGRTWGASLRPAWARPRPSRRMGLLVLMVCFVLSGRPVQQPQRSLKLRADSTPGSVFEIPLMVLVGCDPEHVARCRTIATRSRVLIRALPMPLHRGEILGLHPLVMVVPESVYEGAPWAFEVLAERAEASLLVLDQEPMVPIVLEFRMMEALLFARRLRMRTRDLRAARR